MSDSQKLGRGLRFGKCVALSGLWSLEISYNTFGWNFFFWATWQAIDHLLHLLRGSGSITIEGLF
jgi:hypothetical protein